MRRITWNNVRGAAAPGAVLAAALFVTGAGCAEDHRMSEQQFLHAQEEAHAAELAPLSDEDAEILRSLLDQQLGPFVVGQGDVLEVTVAGPDPEPLLPEVKVRVDRKGEIFLPMVGAVDVAAMELEDVEEAIHRAFVPQFVKDASVFVALVSEGATEVLVRGAVEVPGLVPLRRTQRNVLYAITLAGGMTGESAGRATLRRIRNPSVEVQVDLTTPAGMRAALAEPPLERGDIITVEAAMPNTVFVYGLVYLNRPQEYPAGVRPTVLQALAAAGGLRTDVTPREATLIRHLPEGGDLHVKLNLDKIYSGESENILLAAGDILEVPHTTETRIQDFINRNFFLRAGISVNYNVSGVEFLNRQKTQSGSGLGNDLQDQYDPFGFLSRNQSLSTLTDRPTTNP